MEKSFSMLDLAMIFLRRKKKIAVHFLAVTAFAVGLSYVIPKDYKATVLFLPPYEEETALSGFSLGSILNIGTGSAFSAEQIETLLESRRVLEPVVKRFDLIRVYKLQKEPNKNEAALKALLGKMKIRSTQQSGLAKTQIVHFSLSIIDRNAERSAEMANFVIAELGRAMNELSKGQYSYTETFIRGRLDSVVGQRNTMQLKLANYQKANKIYGNEIQPQVLASIGTYSSLKQERTMTEIQREMLLFDREKDSREVQFTDKKIRELNEKMAEIENSRRPDVMPGLNYSVDVAYEYIDLVQEVQVLAKLELLLRQQYEEARIKSARLAPLVRVVDPARPPEWKNSPKKLLVVLVIVVGYMFLLLASILLAHGVSTASDEQKIKLRQFRELLRLKAG